MTNLAANTIFAFDLAWSGPTGWVHWDIEKDDPVIEYGSFTPQKKLWREIKKKPLNKDATVAFSIYTNVKRIISPVLSNIIVVYEYTDWHRTLANSKANWRVEYAAERKAQRSLGKAEAALTIACMESKIEPIGIGANEAKKEFGARRKDAGARLFAEEYSRFEFRDTGKSFLHDKKLDLPVSHHISDAFIIAAVIARRIHYDRLVENIV